MVTPIPIWHVQFYAQSYLLEYTNYRNSKLEISDKMYYFLSSYQLLKIIFLYVKGFKSPQICQPYSKKYIFQGMVIYNDLNTYAVTVGTSFFRSVKNGKFFLMPLSGL